MTFEQLLVVVTALVLLTVEAVVLMAMLLSLPRLLKSKLLWGGLMVLLNAVLLANLTLVIIDSPPLGLVGTVAMGMVLAFCWHVFPLRKKSS
ncbi:MAG: hypothetical protein K2X27_18130 [Candidatus Obscuribacterales bacterium]|nr:hypothetical protein [Candidatus Obscuribacterales bacterium]